MFVRVIIILEDMQKKISESSRAAGVRQCHYVLPTWKRVTPLVEVGSCYKGLSPRLTYQTFQFLNTKHFFYFRSTRREFTKQTRNIIFRKDMLRRKQIKSTYCQNKRLKLLNPKLICGWTKYNRNGEMRLNKYLNFFKVDRISMLRILFLSCVKRNYSINLHVEINTEKEFCQLHEKYWKRKRFHRDLYPEKWGQWCVKNIFLGMHYALPSKVQHIKKMFLKQ